jgi:diguanylate cyclase (GGDEF)-like protein
LWWERLKISHGEQKLTDHLPFLESFLPEAAIFWRETHEGRTQSDFWTQTDILGQDVHLLAYAVSLSGRQFLLIRSVEEIYKEREMWQVYAHETALQLKTIERLRSEMEIAARALAIANAKLSELSVQDSLTSIYNRRYFEQTFDLELRRTYRSNEPISLLFMDIDHFKSINDTFGHAMGDECLRSIGKLLRDSLHRPGDLAARIGGEEFAIVLPGINAHAAAQLAAGITQKIRDLKIESKTPGVELTITVSVGVYTRPPKGDETMAKMLQIVDDALYKAKRGGRDRIVVGTSRSM